MQVIILKHLLPDDFLFAPRYRDVPQDSRQGRGGRSNGHFAQGHQERTNQARHDCSAPWLYWDEKYV